MKSETVPVLLHGEPVLALEAAAASAIGPKDVVLNLVSGVYAKGFEGWAVRSGAEIVELAVPYDEVIDPAAVEAALKARPDVTVVALCHHDTPSGTINPVAEIGAVVARHGALFLVDAVSSFAGMPVDAAMAKADLFITGPNKCMGCPPALSILGVSEKAWAKMKALPVRAARFDPLDPRLGARLPRRTSFPFTPSVAEINGLEAAVDLFQAEGPSGFRPPRADRQGLPRGRPGHGPEALGQGRSLRLADRDGRPYAGRHRRGGAARRGPRPATAWCSPPAAAPPWAA